MRNLRNAIVLVVAVLTVVLIIIIVVDKNNPQTSELTPGQWIEIECSEKPIQIPAKTFLIVKEENNVILPGQDHQKNGFIKSGMAIFFSEDEIIATGTILAYKIPDYEVVEKAELVRDYQEKMSTTEVPTIYFVG